MNLRSRAQLIVWCLPHLNFAEMNEENSQASQNTNQAPTASNMATLAAKNSIFGVQNQQELPTILPGTQNIIFQDDGNGNTAVDGESSQAS